MSTERDTITSLVSEDISVTSFSGGADRGRCLQLTQSPRTVMNPTGYIQVDKVQALKLIAELATWLELGVSQGEAYRESICDRGDL